jgi:hypothetical protein
MSLLLDIAHCPNVQLCLDHPRQPHPCRKIVEVQRAGSLVAHQLPEPWNGQLERAPILFLSSNPSISEREWYPLANWADDQTEGYFSNRFGGGRTRWVRDGRYVLWSDGVYSPKGVNFWAHMQNRARELLPEHDVQPGKDYVRDLPR